MSYPVKDSPYNYSLPAQKIAMAQKGEEWGKQSVDAIINLSSQTLSNNRSSKFNKQINYNLYNSIFDESDFAYVLNPFGLTGNYKAVATKMKNYNIIRPKIELLKGEEMGRPFAFRVRAVNGEVVSMKQDEKRKAILEHLQGLVATSMGAENEEEIEPLESIEKYFKTGYIHPREVTANQILEYGVQSEQLIEKFNAGWEHALISAEEIYYVGISNNEPKVRVVNPINFDYDKTIELRHIEDAQWAKEERWLSIGEVIDLYGEWLTEKEVERLDKGEVGYPMNKMNYYPGFAYDMQDLKSNDGKNSMQSGNTGSHVYVANVVWKSLRKIGFLTYLDPRTGQEEETIVDEKFKLTEELKEAGAKIKWQWINEIWEGTRIGDNIYVNIRPLTNQFRDMNNPGATKLPYIGYVYNSVNSMSTSMVDLIKTHQYTYMTIWWRLEQEIAKAKGKKLLMDHAKMPKSMGMSMDEWVSHFDNTGVIWYNSMEEGRKNDPSSVSNLADGIKAIDLSLSNVVDQYLKILRELEEQVDRITGVSRQREADIKSSETVGGIERAIQQSNAITEPWFYAHNNVKQKVLNAYIYNFRQTSHKNKKIQYIVNDIESSIINVDGSIFDDTNYNTFVSDSIKDNKIKQKLEGLAQIAMQQEKVKLSDMIQIYKTESISEVESKIVQSEQEFEQRQQGAVEQAQGAEVQAKAAEAEEKQKERDHKSTENHLDRQNKIDVVTINALGFAEDTDVNDNQIPDVLELNKAALESGREAFKQVLEKGKLAVDAKDKATKNSLKSRELDIKMAKIKSDEKMNKENNITALKNKTVGEK